jgi:hypothetical protein
VGTFDLYLQWPRKADRLGSGRKVTIEDMSSQVPLKDHPDYSHFIALLCRSPKKNVETTMRKHGKGEWNPSEQSKLDPYDY